MSTLLEQARAGERITDLEIIDMHGHLGQITVFGIPDNCSESLVADMDRVGVRSIIVSSMACMSGNPEVGNAEVLTAMQVHPGRILGYAAFWPSDPAMVRKQAHHWLNNGFTGMKFHNANGHPYSHPAYAGAYDIANERRLPALFHTWGDEGEFDQIAEIADRYPEMSILLAHSGCCNEAGYIRMARNHPNIYLDLVYSAAPRGLVARLVEAVGSDRVVFGSDSLFFSLTQQVGKVLGADISDRDKEKILSGNAKAILGRLLEAHK